MMTQPEAQQFARDWIGAWNSHNVDVILAHYDDDVTLISPVAAKLLNIADGKVKGKQALRDYFSRGLTAYPTLKFELLDVLCGMSSVILYYVNQKGTKTGEFMELDDRGLVVRVVANYSAEM